MLIEKLEARYEKRMSEFKSSVRDKFICMKIISKLKFEIISEIGTLINYATRRNASYLLSQTNNTEFPLTESF